MNKKPADSKTKAANGAPGFDLYYSKLYGERWQTLKASLLSDSFPLPLKCRLSAPEYFLDPASVLAAATLPLEGAESVLDMCAAPGGKSLVLASLMERGARLKCNERSFDRFKRLERSLRDHLPEGLLERVSISCGDGALLCKKEDCLYDAILLDAPCSSERHVIKDSRYLSQWSPARAKSLAMQQWALVSSAFRLLQAGGFMLYSTCALDPSENIGVTERLAKKFPAAVFASEREVRSFQARAKEKLSPFYDVSSLPDFEPSGDGFLVLPDAQNGAGPIFFCLVKKAFSEQA